MKNSCISSIPVCLKTKVDTKTYRHKTQKLMKYFLMTDQQNINSAQTIMQSPSWAIVTYPETLLG